MLSDPAAYIERFIEAGADTLLIHIEARGDIPAALKRIRELGVRPGITLNPETPAEAIAGVLGDADEVLARRLHLAITGLPPAVWVWLVVGQQAARRSPVATAASASRRESRRSQKFRVTRPASLRMSAWSRMSRRTRSRRESERRKVAIG